MLRRQRADTIERRPSYRQNRNKTTNLVNRALFVSRFEAQLRFRRSFSLARVPPLFHPGNRDSVSGATPDLIPTVQGIKRTPGKNHGAAIAAAAAAASSTGWLYELRPALLSNNLRAR